VHILYIFEFVSFLL